jgi:hypothetical protein
MSELGYFPSHHSPQSWSWFLDTTILHLPWGHELRIAAPANTCMGTAQKEQSSHICTREAKASQKPWQTSVYFLLQNTAKRPPHCKLHSKGTQC